MSLFHSLVVHMGERVVEYVDGACTRVLEPGRHRSRRRAEYHRVTVIERLESTAPQELLTSDGVSVRVTAALRWSVIEAPRFVEAAADPAAMVYLAVQVALRDALVEVASDDVVRVARGELGAVLTEAARATGAELGIAVRSVVVKDVLLPHELRAAYAEVVAVRAHGQAQLEAARAETAALRSLANGAKLLDDHPSLARMRLVQALPHGSTVKLGLPD